MTEAANVPAGDQFEIITEHDASGLLYDPSYLGVARSDAIILIRITLNAGRTLAPSRRTISVTKLNTCEGRNAGMADGRKRISHVART
jgi:hypothetical protein